MPRFTNNNSLVLFNKSRKYFGALGYPHPYRLLFPPLVVVQQPGYPALPPLQLLLPVGQPFGFGNIVIIALSSPRFVLHEPYLCHRGKGVKTQRKLEVINTPCQ
jgi:hypothetical protein